MAFTVKRRIKAGSRRSRITREQTLRMRRSAGGLLHALDDGGHLGLRHIAMDCGGRRARTHGSPRTPTVFIRLTPWMAPTAEHPLGIPPALTKGIARRGDV